jgi:IclR family acetate operon transcriptional repressor
VSKAAEKLLQLMLAVAYSDTPVRLMELVDQTDIDKSTALRLLGTLEQNAFVARDPGSKEYAAGPALLSLAHVLSGRFNFLDLFRSHLGALRDSSGETVSFHLRTGRDRTCIDGMESKQSPRRALLLGDRLPLYVGSAAKTILAFLSSDERAEILADAVATGVNRTELENQIRLVGEQGYLATTDDRLIGVGTISAPIFRGDRVYGSITIAGPSQRWNSGAMEAFAPTLLETATKLSRLVGVQGAARSLQERPSEQLGSP